MITIRHERPADAPAREALLDRAFGACRFEKTCQLLREGRRAADGPSFVASAFGRIVGTVRLWHVAVGGRPALLLGPLAVHPDWRARGVGGLLMRRALAAAGARGHAAVLLVGDAPYYARFGFSAEKTGALSLPGPYEADRLLARELMPGALDGARGLILAARASSERRGGATRVAPAASHAALPHAA
ncbi:MAG: GNAT family N-acetyltransferase [Rhodoplanes sp.]